MEEHFENCASINEDSQTSQATPEAEFTEKSTPKITAKIFISMDSVVESLTPRSNDLPPQTVSTTGASPRELRGPTLTASPRSAASPRTIDSHSRHTSSPRDESSSRDLNSPRKPGSRVVGFFEKIGSKKFSKRKSSHSSPRSPKETNPANTSTISFDESGSDASIKSLSCTENLIQAKARTSSLVIQKQKSFVGKNDAIISTEIQYSPRQNSLMETGNSPNSRKLSRGTSEDGSRSNLLVYCGNEIMAWCKNQSLNCQYNNLTGEFIIKLKNEDNIHIQGYRIQASTLNKETITALIDLIKTLPHIEKVLIYYDSLEGIDIDHSITSQLTSGSEDTVQSTLNM